MAEKQYMVKASTARKLQRLIRDTPLDATRIDRFREWPPGVSNLIAVDAIVTGGSATANPANWRYTLRRAFTDVDLLTDVDPTALPHRFQRPPFGLMKQAKAGFVVVNPDANQQGEPPYVVWDLNEVPNATTCPGP